MQTKPVSTREYPFVQFCLRNGIFKSKSDELKTLRLLPMRQIRTMLFDRFKLIKKLVRHTTIARVTGGRVDALLGMNNGQECPCSCAHSVQESGHSCPVLLRLLRKVRRVQITRILIRRAIPSFEIPITQLLSRRDCEFLQCFGLLNIRLRHILRFGDIDDNDVGFTAVDAAKPMLVAANKSKPSNCFIFMRIEYECFGPTSDSAYC